jgi:hypothetical protein
LTHPKQEKKKGELMKCEHIEWTKSVSKEFVYPRNKRNRKLGKHGIPTDVATGACITNLLQEEDVEVDFILPEKVSKERLRSNDLNFLLVYDVLEAFHTDKSANRKVYKNLKSCLLGAKNVFPPREYQEFVYSKINYYKYLKEKKVNILPTFSMTTEEYNKLGHDAAMKEVLHFWNHENLGKVIAKPVYGQEGKDFEIFTPKEKVQLSNYFKSRMKKYPGIVVQKMVQGFGCTAQSPELRMYYLGDKYRYSVCASANTQRTWMTHPVAEGGTLKAPFSKLKAVSQKILKKLPPIVMPNGVRLPRLISRIDLGYLVDGQYQPFVNEVEFVPSLYAEYKPMREQIEGYVVQCAKQMVKITKQYVERSRKCTKLSQAPRGTSRSCNRHVLKAHVLKRKKP